MCGIVGTWRREPIDRSVFEAMLTALAHRGPDGTGTVSFDAAGVTLGHRRLAIIDLSEAASQPMSNEDGTISLTFNGEIYNFRELREVLQRSGHRFRSQSDSEVIVHAYEEWGDDCVHHLNGIFAFAIWDDRRKRLFLARDHLGVKPLYYSETAAGFTFASETRAILADPAFPRSLEPEALRDFFAFGYVPYDRCSFAGIKKLPAGHRLVLERGRVTTSQYWTLQYKPQRMSMGDAVAAVDATLGEVVRAQLVSNVEVGVFLSGGIDSSLLTALARSELGPTLKTFTIGFDEPSYDESSFANLVVKALGTDHHETRLSRAVLPSVLLSAIDAYDELFEANGAIPTYSVGRLARESGTKVVLGGDGADEIFAGYTWYDAFTAAPTRPRNPLRALARAVRARLRPEQLASAQLGSHLSRVVALDGGAQAQLVPAARRRAMRLERWPWSYEHFDRRGVPQVTRMQHIDVDLFLVDHVLCKVDRATMAWGVETRVPFLDRRLVELAFTIPSQLTYRDGERKAVLKAVARKHLPAEVVSPRKKGFSSPMAAWTEPSILAWGRNLISGGRLMDAGYLERGWEATLSPRGEHNAVRGFWLVLVAELWMRRWLQQEPRSSLPPLPGVSAQMSR
jgi:asparagine synthase (glutamine-hydrolysing)